MKSQIFEFNNSINIQPSSLPNMASKQGKDDVSTSSSSRRSKSTSNSSAVIKARARAEAAKARVSFAEREAQLKKLRAQKQAELQLENAILEADLEELGVQREAAAAEAEAEILEAAEEEDFVSATNKDREPVPEEVIAERTSEYVEEQNKLHSAHASTPGPPGSDESLITWGTPISESPSTSNAQHVDSKPPVTPITQHGEDYKPPVTPNSQHREVSKPAVIPKTPADSTPLYKKPKEKALQRELRREMDPTPAHHTMNPAAQSFIPHQSANRSYIPQQHAARSPNPQHVRTRDDPAPVTNDLARYLARRDLVSTSLFNFDDRPESYRAWESSFNNAVRGIGLTASEEMDLLTKWLGKESSEHVKRIRSVHVSDPEEALRKAWRRLQDCYASPEVIENAIFKKLDNFPKISAKDYTKLRELGDLLMEIQCAKEEGYLQGLRYLDTARGIAPVIEKLPHALQERWVTHGSRFKEEHCGHFPPFDFFARFIYDEARIRNDPSFILLSNSSTCVPGKPDRPKSSGSRNTITVHKTDVSGVEDSDKDTPKRKNDGPGRNCPIHNNKPHPLRKCKSFRAKTLDERKSYLKENGICFKCLASTAHMAKDCDVTVKCSECDSTRHNTAMHAGPAQPKASPPDSSKEEEEKESPSTSTVDSHCTEVCGVGQAARSCSKICLVRVYPQGQRDKAINTYVILDDQSNRSLARTNFFELFDIQSQPSSYSLRTCAGTIDRSGRRAEGFQIESLDGKVSVVLPTLIECNEILNNRSEIPTPDAALHHPHLRSVAANIPALDSSAEILLLLGRDIVRVHKVRQQINGPHDAPFAQRLDLGWVLVGDVCLGNAHKPHVSTFKTNLLENGRPTLLTPCESFLQIKEKVCGDGGERQGTLSKPRTVTEQTLGLTVFNRTNADNKPAPSIQDIMFLNIMDREVYRDDTHSWVAPLPFKVPRQRLPNNRQQALNRLASLQRTLDRKPEMRAQYVTFMGKIFENGHAEQAPPLREDEECWYLPTFGVYHPRKPGQIRVVFDSSAQHSGISLNDVLLTGPDLNNSLLGVLIRFRKEQVAILADIQQMFHCFLVREDHRNYLRFLWYRDNDMSKDIVDYRMRVHVFGNSPSPAVAIYGLRRAAQEGARKYGSDTVQFVEHHFYVDDGLLSLPTEAEAINLLQRTQASLSESNLRLHKFVSNRQAVMDAFPLEDCAAGVKDMDLSGETATMQRSLGLCWNTATDTFTFSVSTSDKPFTRRGVLSIVNSLIPLDSWPQSRFREELS